MRIEYIFIKSIDEYCMSEEMFQNLLCFNNRIIFKAKEKKELNKNILLFDDNKLSYALELNKVEKSKEINFHFMVETLGEEDKQVTILEDFDSLIKTINEKFGRQFSINTIWNDVSLYYARKLYPDILNVENLLRKIIYLFMLKTVGSKWFDEGTPEKFQSSINSVIERNNENKNEINSEWLTYADFIDLGHFFTAPYSLKSDLKSLFNELKQYKNTETALDDEKKIESKDGMSGNKAAKPLTEGIIKKLSDEYEQKNNWERYFSDKLSVKSPNKFSKDWSSLYDIRNKVAHGKPISKTIFDKAIKLINIYTTAFKECIDIIDTLEITIEEAKAVEAVAQQVIPKESTDKFRNEDIQENKLKLVFPGKNIFPDNNKLEFSANTVSISKDFLKPSEELRRSLSKINHNYDEILHASNSMQKMFEPLSVQIRNVPNISEMLNVESIRSALDQPLIVDIPIQTMGIDGIGNLAAESSESHSESEIADLKTEFAELDENKSNKVDLDETGKE